MKLTSTYSTSFQYLLFIITLLICFQPGIAQEWAWMKGSDLPDQAGVYGMKGVEDAANTPSARNGPNMWADNSNNLWLLGGYGIDDDGNLGSFNGLWRYNIGSNNWTWMKGENVINPTGVYGMQGVSDPANEPAPRMRSANWTDAEGNLWMFGGLLVTIGRYSDMWKYDIASNEWTWVNGADTLDGAGNYGTIGMADPGNAPGARHAALYWKDLDGNFWMFGGFGYASVSGADGWLSDLWKYDIASNEWTWVNGADTVNAPVVYGELGIEGPNNQPGGRGSSVSWTDAEGNLWLFGGIGTGRRNDLWKYDIATNQWTWVKGSDQVLQFGMVNIDDPSMPMATDNPGARNGHTGVVDLRGDLWLFGGFGLPGFTEEQGFLNDTWRYEIDTDLWYFMNGTLAAINDPGTFGTQGIAAPDNTPPSLASPASILDNEGNIWLFGGNNSNIRQNALWKLSGGSLVDVKDLDKHNTLQLEIFPNPAKEKLILHLASDQLLGGNAQIKVMDARGHLLHQMRFTNHQQELSLEGLPSGNYFLLIQIEEKLYSKRFVKY